MGSRKTKTILATMEGDSPEDAPAPKVWFPSGVVKMRLLQDAEDFTISESAGRTGLLCRYVIAMRYRVIASGSVPFTKAARAAPYAGLVSDSRLPN
jgi:hypothetical protein